MNALVERTAAELLAIEDRWGAHNYHPLPVVVSRAEGCWVYDLEGRRYLDCLSAYSAVNQGHAHPKIVAALIEQAKKVTLTSRAFHNDQLPLFCKAVAELTGLDVVLPMNTGAEAVETAIKAARRWGHERKQIPDGTAEIIVCAGNFHGRTTTIISASSDASYKRGFGPLTPGFVIVPYGDLEALAAAITPRTCAFLVEPIQCEAGIIMPPHGYLAAAASLCRTHNVLFMADEIQTGLGRTGTWFACEHERVIPDVYILGKALSGGVYPVSVVAGRREVMEVFTPGSHGSTYGGNPLGCAVALAALRVIADEQLAERSATLGALLLDLLQPLVRGPRGTALHRPDGSRGLDGTAQPDRPAVRSVRGRGLLIGVELDRPARPVCEQLVARGILCKETHDFVIRLAPPLVIDEADVRWLAAEILSVLG